MALENTIVLSGAPGTGKTTVGTYLAERLGFPFLSLDLMKEALADVLDVGGEEWSNRLGDAAAEIIFRLNRTFADLVVEGWWRRERRDRALTEFEGCVEVFCTCDPEVAEARMRARVARERHPIHRDVINPSVHLSVAELVRRVEPLSVGTALIRVDTTEGFDRDLVVARTRAALGLRT